MKELKTFCYYCDKEAVAYDPFDKMDLCREHANEMLDAIETEYTEYKRDYMHSTELI